MSEARATAQQPHQYSTDLFPLTTPPAAVVGGSVYTIETDADDDGEYTILHNQPHPDSPQPLDRERLPYHYQPPPHHPQQQQQEKKGGTESSPRRRGIKNDYLQVTANTATATANTLNTANSSSTSQLAKVTAVSSTASLDSTGSGSVGGSHSHMPAGSRGGSGRRARRCLCQGACSAQQS